MQIDMTEALCRTQYASKAKWWDEDLDGNVKNQRAETNEERAQRHLIAKSICRACTQRSVCFFIGSNDPNAKGIYGGELV